MHFHKYLKIIGFLIFIQYPLHAKAVDLSSYAEKTDFRETGRFDEVIELCHNYAATYNAKMRCEQFGSTPEGRPMLALLHAPKNVIDSAGARAKNLPVVLVQGGIHAGEIDGKDAGFLALRELLADKKTKAELDKMIWIFVPVFNIDGHERFKAWNRPNQRGPEKMGWRATAQNYNLNRDYIKADAPEMQSMLRLINRWDPLFTIDLHVTDGAQFEHDVAVMIEPNYAGDENLRLIGKTLRDNINAALEKKGSLPLPFYPAFIENDNPLSGFADSVAPARFSTGYFLHRNRFGILVETHSWRPYKHRVQVTKNILLELAHQVAKNAKEWQSAAKTADFTSSLIATKSIAVEYAATKKSRIIDFRGYAYTRTMSDISGELMTHYDESKPELWKIPLFDEVLPSQTLIAPTLGYWIPPSYVERAKHYFDLHQIEYRECAAKSNKPMKYRQSKTSRNSRCSSKVGRSVNDKDATSIVPSASNDVLIETFRATGVALSAQSFEGRQRATVTGQWKVEKQVLPAGGLVVPIAQKNARLVLALLEPTAPDSLVAWGEFNTAWEQKEYIEAYVAEQFAREMIQEDNTVKLEFEQFLKAHPEYEKNPIARLDFFYRKHSAWDERFNMYPIFRLQQNLQAQ